MAGLYSPADGDPYAFPENYLDYGSKFVCGRTCCTILPPSGSFLPPPPPPPPSVCQPLILGQPLISSPPPYACGGGPRRGVAGWVEVGWAFAAPQRPVAPLPPPLPSRLGRRLREPSLAERSRQERQKIAAAAARERRSSGNPNQWRPRSSYGYSEDNDDDDNDDDYVNDDVEYDARRRRPPPPCEQASVRCNARRYRLYARPAFGWCRGFGANQWSYGVTEEGVYDAVFIVLNDDPRRNDDGGGCGGYGGRCGSPWQQLQSGDAIRIPGEPCPFIVRLYSDDWSY